MQLAHSGDLGLTGLFVGAHLEGRVLLGEAPERDRHLLLVDLRLGLDRDLDHGLGEDDVLQTHRSVRGGEGVASHYLLDSDARGNVPGVYLGNLLALVGVHHQNAPDPLGATAVDVEHARAGLQTPGVDAEVGQLADVRVGHDLEGQRREGLGVVGVARDLALALLAADQFVADDRRHVQRRGQVVEDGVKQRLHALVLERRTTQHGGQMGRERRLADRLLEQLLGNLGLLEDQLDQLVIVVRDFLEQVFASGDGGFEQVLGDLLDLLLLAELVLVDDRLHRHQVDHAEEATLGADRELNRYRLGAETIDHRLHATLEVRADAVHLVDVRDPRDVVLVGLTPDGLRLGLDAGDGVEQRDRAVEHAQRALDLDREIDVAGRVDDVDPMPLPLGRRGRGGDRDAALLLLFHPVHRRGAVVDLADLVRAPGVVEDALGRRRLAGVDVRHDPDVACVLECELAWHEREWCRYRESWTGLEVSTAERTCDLRAKKRGPSGPRALLVLRPVAVLSARGLHVSMIASRRDCSHEHPSDRAGADYSSSGALGLRAVIGASRSRPDNRRQHVGRGA